MVSDQIRYFITIVDTGSYTEAALELDIAQSTVSKQIQALERELGVALFDRASRKAALTEAGMALLPEMRTLLTHMDHLLYSASKLQPGYAQRFSVVTLPFVGCLSLSPPLGRFELENPDFQLVVREMEEPQLMQHLLRDSFDVAITYEYEFRRSGLDQPFFPIVQDELVFVVHRNHPLAKQAFICAEDLADVPLLLMQPFTCIAKLCDNYFRNQKIVPSIIFRGTPETVFGGVEAGRGGTLLGKRQCQYYFSTQAVLLPLQPPIPITVGAVPGKNQQHQKQITHLIDLLIHSGETAGAVPPQEL